MGDKMKLSKVSLFFFVFNYFYLYFRMYLFPFLFNNYNSISYIYFMSIIIFIIILILLLPKKLFNLNLNKIFLKSKFKYIYYPYTLIRIGISLYLTSLLLKETFFLNNNLLLLVIGLFIGIIVLSLSSNKDIIDISTFFYILIFVVTIFSLLDIANLDFSLLKSNVTFDLEHKFILLIFPIMIDIIILISTNNSHISFTKLNIIIPLILSVILVLFEYYILLLASGKYLFLNYIYVGFVSLSIQKLSILVGNLSFLYILTIIISLSFKASYLLSNFRIKKSYKIILFEILTIFLIFFVFYILKISILDGLSFQLFYLIIGLIYLFFILKEYITNVKRLNKK